MARRGGGGGKKPCRSKNGRFAPCGGAGAATGRGARLKGASGKTAGSNARIEGGRPGARKVGAVKNTISKSASNRKRAANSRVAAAQIKRDTLKRAKPKKSVAPKTIVGGRPGARTVGAPKNTISKSADNRKRAANSRIADAQIKRDIAARSKKKRKK